MSYQPNKGLKILHFTLIKTKVFIGLSLLAIVATVALWLHPVSLAEAYQPRSGDRLHNRIRTELESFTSWLTANSAKGYIGEVGWPDNSMGDAESWNLLAETWYRDADAADLWVTNWATGVYWNATYKLKSYTKSNSVIDTPNSQAEVLEKHLSTPNYQRGINVAGGEFGVATDGSYSNINPGTHGVEYIYDGQSTFDYLASRGVSTVRIPFRWERIQPNLNSPLDATELQRLTDVVNRAGNAGITSILDMHNYAEYWLHDGTKGVRRKLDSNELPISSLVDAWTRLSTAFKSNPNIAAYGLMNEPHGMSTKFMTTNSLYDFNADSQSWQGEGVTTVAHSATTFQSGGGSIAATKTHGAGSSVTRFNDARGGSVRDISANGLTLSCYIYLPNGTSGTGWQGRIEVQNSSYAYTAGPVSNLVAGVWTEVNFTLPLSLAQSARAIAIQASGNNINGSATVFADSCTQKDGLQSGAQRWEYASQQVLSAIRSNEDANLIMVSGYNWSGVQNWSSTHPTSWIADPEDNFRYEAHHYWDTNNSGVYNSDYSQTLADVTSYTSTGTAAPQISTFTVNGPSTVSSTNIELNIVATDDVDASNDLQVMVSEHASFSGTVWQPYVNLMAYTLNSTSGVKTIYAKVRDSAGNVSEYKSTTVNLTPPSPSLTPTNPSSPSLALTVMAGQVFNTSYPRLTGTSNPGDKIEVTVKSEPQIGIVETDSNGYWTYTPSSELENGDHTYSARLVNSDGTFGDMVGPVRFSVLAETSGLPFTGSSATPWMLFGTVLTCIGLALKASQKYSRPKYIVPPLM